MPDDLTHAIDLSASIATMRDELPGLLGVGDWGELPASFRDALQLLGRGADPQLQRGAAEEVGRSLAHYPKARDAVLARAAELGDLRESITPAIREFLGSDPAADHYATGILRGVVGTGSESPPKPVRGVKLKQRGKGGATSVKLRNVWVNPGKVVEFLTHSAMTTAESILHPNPVTIGLGVILLANCARESVTIHIPEHDATVFWGLLQAQKLPGNTAAAPEPVVVTRTNEERVQSKLGPISADAVSHSLNYLAGISCVDKITRTPAHWFITETFKIS